MFLGLISRAFENGFSHSKQFPTVSQPVHHNSVLLCGVQLKEVKIQLKKLILLGAILVIAATAFSHLRVLPQPVPTATTWLEQQMHAQRLQMACVLGPGPGWTFDGAGDIPNPSSAGWCAGQAAQFFADQGGGNAVQNQLCNNYPNLPICPGYNPSMQQSS